MHLYLKELPILGNISFVVEVVTKGECSEQRAQYKKTNFRLHIENFRDAAFKTSSRYTQEDSKAENVARTSPRVDFETRK